MSSMCESFQERIRAYHTRTSLFHSSPLKDCITHYKFLILEIYIEPEF